MKYVKCLLCVMAASYFFISRMELHHKKGRCSQLKNEATSATMDSINKGFDIIFFQVFLFCHLSYIN